VYHQNLHTHTSQYLSKSSYSHQAIRELSITHTHGASAHQKLHTRTGAATASLKI
jgi:hypothetical protein